VQVSHRDSLNILHPERRATGIRSGRLRLRCPQAEVVFDLFHVVARYGREVIDRVRVDEANRLRHDKATLKIVKSSKWLLLRNWENLSDEKTKVRLNELLKANQALMTVYLL